MEKPPEQNSEQKEAWGWENYYDLIGEKGHTKNLETAVSLCQQKDEALDLGAGGLRDTKFLLDRGFNVTALDSSPASAEAAEQLNNPSLTMIPKIIRDYKFPKNYFSLVNAQGIIFHLPQEKYKIILDNISNSLKPHGVLCIEFIGENDDWNTPERKKIILTKENLDLLKEVFEIKSLNEYEVDESEETRKMKAEYKNDNNYKPKHWHHIDIIAVKK